MCFIGRKWSNGSSRARKTARCTLVGMMFMWQCYLELLDCFSLARTI
jgi:hypothetical protein